MAPRTTTRGMSTFVTIWAGQLFSLIGSGLTGFALGIWLYNETGSVTLFALNSLLFILPQIVISPVAGALVDRWDRRWVMILSDTGAGLSTLFLALALLNGGLQVWHVYLATLFNSLFATFQWPAYSAATTLLVPKKHLGRAGGMVQIGEAISQLISPALAGALLVTTGLWGILLIDFATFGIAVFSLLLVRVPRPESSAEGSASKSTLLQEASVGWKYITARSGLLGLLIYFSVVNFLWAMVNPVLIPMVLETTTPEMLGYLASIVGVGMLLGTLVMSAWGGPGRRVLGVLGFGLIFGLLSIMLGMQPSLLLMGVAGFGIMFSLPIVNGSNQALWQSKVEPDLQGRVFSVRRMIAVAASPLAYLLVGPLADQVFEPLMAVQGPLSETVGQIIGVGPGRGYGLMFILAGASIVGATLIAYMNPRIRNVQEDLPDVVTDSPEPIGARVEEHATGDRISGREPAGAPAH